MVNLEVNSATEKCVRLMTVMVGFKKGVNIVFNA